MPLHHRVVLAWQRQQRHHSHTHFFSTRRRRVSLHHQSLIPSPQTLLAAMPPRQTTDGKVQTRLILTPLPSSSPAKSSQPEATRDRAAHVRISDNSPRPPKRRRLDQHSLPSPKQSSATLQSSPSSSLRHHHGKKSFMSSGTVSKSDMKRKKTVLPTFSSDDSDSDLAPLTTQPAASSPIAISTGTLPSSDESESDEVVVTKVKRKRPRQSSSVVSLSPSPANARDTSGDDSDVVVASSSARKARPVVLSSSSSSSEEDNPPPSSATMRKGKKQKTEAELDLEEDMDFLGSSSTFESHLH